MAGLAGRLGVQTGSCDSEQGWAPEIQVWFRGCRSPRAGARPPAVGTGRAPLSGMPRHMAGRCPLAEQASTPPYRGAVHYTRAPEAWRGGAVPGAVEGAFCSALWAPMYLTVAGSWEDGREAWAQLQRGAPGKGVEGVAVSSWQQMSPRPPLLPALRGSGNAQALLSQSSQSPDPPARECAQRWSCLWLVFQVSPGRADVSDSSLCGARHCAHTDSQEMLSE